MTFNFSTFWGVIAIGNGLMIILFLLSRLKRSFINAFLLILLTAIFSYQLAHNLLVYNQSSELIISLGFTNFLYLLTGPIVFALASKFINISFRFRLVHLWHLFPFILLSVLYITLLNTAGTFFHNGQQPNQNVEPWMSVSYGVLRFSREILYFLHPSIYLMISIWLCWKARFNLSLRIGRYDLSLINRWQWVTGFLIIDLYLVYPWVYHSSPAFWLSSSIIIGTQFFVVLLLVLSNSRVDRLFAEKYAGSSLDVEREEVVFQELTQEMISKKTYLRSNLTITLLAMELDIGSKHLSQVINSRSSKTFKDFINFYRVGDAKKKLLDPENDKFTVESMGYAVGFNSKDSFYRAFKKECGMTPAEYKKQYRSTN